MPRSSNGMFVNCHGQKVTSLTNLTPVARPSPKTGTPIPSGTFFPGATKLIPAGSTWDWYWRIRVNSKFMGADGRNIASFGAIMAYLLWQPDPSIDANPKIRIGSQYASIPRKTAIQRDDEVFDYRDLVDAASIDPTNPEYLAEAENWVALVNAVNYVFETEYAPERWGKTSYIGGSITMAHFNADINAVLTDPRVTFGAEDV